jgi:hypothetical protein
MEDLDDKHLLHGADPQRAATPLHVPDGYFDGLTPRIMQAVRAQAEARPAPSAVWMPRILGLAGALGTVAVLAVVYMGLPHSQTGTHIDLAEATEGLTIEDVALLTDAGPDDLVASGLLLPDTLYGATATEDEAAIQLLIESGIDEEDLLTDIEI